MKIKRYQMGGEVAADPNAAPIDNDAPMEGAQDPMEQIVMLFAQGLEQQNCEALAQGAQMFLELVQQAQGGAEAAPAGQPVFGKGGKIVSRKQTSLQLVRK